MGSGASPCGLGGGGEQVKADVGDIDYLQAAMPSTHSATPAPARMAAPALSAGGPTPASVLLASGAKTAATVSERALLGVGRVGMCKTGGVAVEAE